MPKNTDDVCLSDLALELKVKKSKLNFYASHGILKQVYMVGGAKIYSRKESLKRLKKAESLRKHGFTLQEAGKELNKENVLLQGD